MKGNPDKFHLLMSTKSLEFTNIGKRKNWNAK